MSEIKIPNVIWLQWYGDGDPVDGGPQDTTDVSWCESQIFDHDVQYVRADASSSEREAQPIETAPKDGTQVLLWCPKLWGTGAWTIGMWDEDLYAIRPRPYWSMQSFGGSHITYSRNNQPTHWLPLPAPLPNTGEGGGE
jgi:hypothetical protein